MLNYSYLVNFESMTLRVLLWPQKVSGPPYYKH